MMYKTNKMDIIMIYKINNINKTFHPTHSIKINNINLKLGENMTIIDYMAMTMTI